MLPVTRLLEAGNKTKIHPVRIIITLKNLDYV